MNWRPWVTRTSATTPKESRIGSMPACRSRASITILGDSARTETNYLAPAGPYLLGIEHKHRFHDDFVTDDRAVLRLHSFVMASRSSKP